MYKHVLYTYGIYKEKDRQTERKSRDNKPDWFVMLMWI